MRITLTEPQRIELDAAAAAEKGVRRWKRYRAVLLRGEGMTVAAVAHTLECSQASVYAWTAAWRQDGAAGLREGDHSGRKRTLGSAGETVVMGLLGENPQARGHRATGWTVLRFWEHADMAAASAAVFGQWERAHDRPPTDR